MYFFCSFNFLNSPTLHHFTFFYIFAPVFIWKTALLITTAPVLLTLVVNIIWPFPSFHILIISVSPGRTGFEKRNLIDLNKDGSFLKKINYIEKIEKNQKS